MSKIIVDTIESTGTTVTVNDGLASGAINAGTNAITAGSVTGLTATSITSGTLGAAVKVGNPSLGQGRNILINGNMCVYQRSNSVSSISTSGYKTLDRWHLDISSLGTWTQTFESTGGPTSFPNSLKMECTSADASPAASDYLIIQQRLEGNDVQGLKKGSTDALQATLSFWVKSDETGTYTVELYDNDNTRFVGATYSISTAATWEYKTITFPADTTGALGADANYSLGVHFWLAAGSDYTGGTFSTTWNTTQGNRVSSTQVNLAAATSNYWQVTGVQLEVGAEATDYERESYAKTIEKCFRYFWKSYNTTVNPGTAASSGLRRSNSNGSGHFVCSITFPYPMRATPTSTTYTSTGTSSTWSSGYSGNHGINVTLSSGANTTDGCQVQCDAEL